MLFFFMGGMEAGSEVFDGFWPGARGVSDDALAFYRGFRLTRWSARRIFGPRTFLHAFRALRRGYRQRRVAGDPRMMPGMFFLRGREVLWLHRYRDPGDEPDYASIPRLD